MKRVFEVINELEKERTIQKYALGGAFALLFHATEPVNTSDVDIFVYFEVKKGKFIDLTPIFKALEKKGYKSHEHEGHVVIEGTPVQFLPLGTALVEQAFDKAETKKIEEVPVRVFSFEYLIAIMLETNRPKDRMRLATIWESSKMDRTVLFQILADFGLRKRLEEVVGKVE